MHRRTGLKNIVALLLVAALMAAVCPDTSAEVPGESEADRDARMAWWREARFGMFIHWGLYAIPAGEWNGKPVENIGEWIMFNGKITPEEYEPLAQQFNPIAFDADAWVRLAKRAGMKYIVITSKHHDGFCLFNTALTDYNVMNTPFQRDILQELAEACRREDIKLCFYHSILDWHHPDYLPRGEGSPRPWDTRPTEGADHDRYIEYMKGQLRELLTNYGDIGVIWFDGGWEHKPEEHRAEEVTAMIREIKPDIIINNRIKIPQDFDTPEQKIPATGIPGRDWETCMTMNSTWGFKKDDANWKPTDDLLKKLVDIASKGGNYLLNVGPTAAGVIPYESVERLAAMGAWMDVNGESIYGTSASPFANLPWGRCTQKPTPCAEKRGGLFRLARRCPSSEGTTLYLHVFDWPADGQLVVPGLKNELKEAYLLADTQHTPLAVSRTGDDVTVALPANAPDPIVSVVVLEIDGAPDVVNPPEEEVQEGEAAE